jgi:SAM-dependent methyltransferase
VAVGADPDSLTRVLRGLVLDEVLAEAGGGRFALTEVGERLRGDVPGSLREGVLVTGELYYRAGAGMLAAVRDGGTAFEQVYGDRFFEYLSRHPEQEAAFQGAMTGRSEDEAGHVVAAYDFGGLGRLVDVGGGHGILLGAILRSAPDLRAVLVDQPAVVEQARRRLAAGGVAGRCELVAGDFFGDLPAGADAYLLSRVLHDWADDDARRILAACRSAMSPGGRLLIVEALLPERAADQPAVIRLDLHMLVLLRPGAHRGPVPPTAGRDRLRRPARGPHRQPGRPQRHRGRAGRPAPLLARAATGASTPSSTRWRPNSNSWSSVCSNTPASAALLSSW